MFATMPTLLAGFLVLGTSIALAVVGVLVGRRPAVRRLFSGNSEVIGITYPMVGLVYGVFLAFTVVLAWDSFAEAESSATQEVTRLSELWRDAEVFPTAVHDRLHDRLIAYARAVVDHEWRTMAEEGRASEVAGDAYEGIWECYYAFEPEGPRQIAFYQESLSQLNELGRQRRLRILHSRSTIPGIMWTFLIAGAVVSLAFCFVLWTERAWSQVVVTALLAALISYSILLVYALQRPFTGDVSIEPEAFTGIIRSFEARKDDPPRFSPDAP